MADTTKIFGRMGMFIETYEENARKIASFNYSSESIPKSFKNIFQQVVQLPFDRCDIVFSDDVFVDTGYWNEWIRAFERLVGSLCLVDVQLVMHSIFEDVLTIYSYVFEVAAPGIERYSFKRTIYEIDLNSPTSNPQGDIE